MGNLIKTGPELAHPAWGSGSKNSKCNPKEHWPGAGPASPGLEINRVRINILIKIWPGAGQASRELEFKKLCKNMALMTKPAQSWPSHPAGESNNIYKRCPKLQKN